MFEFKHYTYRHSGGSKDYNLILVHDEVKNLSMLIRRWGAIGSKGQSMQRAVKGDGETSFAEEHKKRDKKDYYTINEIIRSNASKDEILELLSEIDISKAMPQLTAFLGTDEDDSVPDFVEPEVEVERPDSWGTW